MTDDYAIYNAVGTQPGVERLTCMLTRGASFAAASAVLHSLIETAKANGQEPYEWLRHVMERLPQAESVEDFEALLPWNRRTS